MSDYPMFWKNRDEIAGKAGTYCHAQNFGISHPSINALYNRFIRPHPTSRSGFVIMASTYLKLIVSGEHHIFGGEADLSVPSALQKLDTGASLTAGRDYYIYLCLVTDASGEKAADIKVSLNSTIPSGFTADTSRKIGGFHTLCAAVPNDAANADSVLKGYNAGDILPNSIWCLTHRAETGAQEGKTYVPPLNEWHYIYLQSGTGSATKSVFGGTITNSRAYMDHVDDLAAVGDSMLSDEEFQVAAEGSNQQTNIRGNAAPVTTGGHSDTKGRRMVSSYGLEDCCGALWQWVKGGGWRYTGTTAQGETLAPMAENPTTNWPGEKGQLYWSDGRPGFLAGGVWDDGARCGTRARRAGNSRSSVSTKFGCRGRARNCSGW